MRDQPRADPRTRYGRALGLLLTLSPVIAVLALAFVLSSTLGDSGGAGNLRTATGIGVVRPIDRPAPGFRLPALTGHASISLAQYRGHVVVLNFWASWCHPCRQEAPALERLWNQFRGRGVQFLGIDHRDGRGDALAFRGEYGITYPSGYDPGGLLSAQYGLVGIPTTFIVGADGRLRYEVMGRVEGQALGEALGRVVPGGAP